MFKKSHIVTSLFILLCSFQTQGNSDDHKVHGALLFGASIVAFKAFSSKIEFQNDVAGAHQRAQLATNEQFQKNIQRRLKDCEQLQQPKQAYATQDTASKSSQVQSIKNVDDELPIIDTQNLTDLIPTTATVVAPIIQQAIAIKPSPIQKISNENKAFLETFFTNRPSRQAIVPTSTIIATSLAHAAASLDSPSPTSVARVISSRVVSPHQAIMPYKLKYPNFNFFYPSGQNPIVYLDQITTTTDSRSNNIFESINPGNTAENKTIRQYTVQPKDAVTQKTIILPYVHGTYFSRIHSNGTQGLATDNNIPLFLLAKKIAHAENATVKVLCFQWDGGLSVDNRKQAGVDLAHEIETIRNASGATTFNGNNISVWTASHSHGGNVVYHAAQELKKKEIKIDQAILFGCPTPDVNVDDVNMANILNIYGESDFTACAGSYQQALGTCSIYEMLQGKWHMPNIAASLRKKNATNIVLKLDGRDLMHKETASIGLEHLPSIMQCLDNQFPNVKNVIINVENKNDGNKNDGTHITGCFDPEHIDNAITPAINAINNENTAAFSEKYSNKSIYEKMSPAEKFKTEWGKFIGNDRATKIIMNIIAAALPDDQAYRQRTNSPKNGCSSSSSSAK